MPNAGLGQNADIMALAGDPKTDEAHALGAEDPKAQHVIHEVHVADVANAGAVKAIEAQVADAVVDL